MGLVTGEPATRPTDYLGSLQYQRRSLLALEAFPGSMLHEADTIMAANAIPTAAGCQRLVEIMVALNIDAQDLARRAEDVRQGKLQLANTFKTI